MGFWKDVYSDMQCGLPEKEAIALNIRLRQGGASERQDILSQIRREAALGKTI